MLSSAALDAAIEALPEEGNTLPLRLSPAVAALQCAISTGVLREDHVAVQSMYRLCLQLFKAERSVPPETFDALRSLDETMLVNHGQSGLNMLRGKGGGQAGVHANARELADDFNSGSFHPTTIRRRLPRRDSASRIPNADMAAACRVFPGDIA
jgi:hypothetical protein